MNNTLYKLAKGLSGLALASMMLYSCNTNKSDSTDTSVVRKYDRVHVDSRLGKSNKIIKYNKSTGKKETKIVKYNHFTEQKIFVDLITQPVYDKQFNSIDNADDKIAGQLYSQSLDDLVKYGAISSDNNFLKDFWLPLGLKNSDEIDYKKGMRDCWDEKISKWGAEISKSNLNVLRSEKKESLSKLSDDDSPSSLREYRRDEIAKAVNVLHELTNNYLKSHYTKKSVKDKEMKRLLLNVDEMFSANVMLGYNIQELFPPSFAGDKINAVAKAYLLDQWLSGGGKAMLERTPARYDPCLSYGAFQLTKYPMADIAKDKLNSYVSKENRIPTSMSDLRTLQDHTTAAAMFAFKNWNILGDYLSDRNILKKFNDGFEKLDKKEKQIVLAGITACMHHAPLDTKKAVTNYVSHNSVDNMHYKLYQSLGKQLDKYYQSSAEAYLVMKVFNILDDKYSK